MNENIILKYYDEYSSFYKDKSINNAYLCDGALPLIRFKCFDNLEWMDAIMTTRIGGVSKDHLSSLNLGTDRGDNPENVIENYTRVTNAIGLPVNSIIKAHQVHSDIISYVDRSYLPAGPTTMHFYGSDGLITDTSGIAICVGAADCVPILIAASDTKEVAGVHSGWKGTTLRIGKKAVEILVRRGASLDNIIALIGPSISQKNYEVTSDVIGAFHDSGFSMADISKFSYQTDDIHYQLDLWAACYIYLIEAGLSPTNIHFAGLCTYDNPGFFYSHRYTSGKRGNQNAIIFIK